MARAKILVVDQDLDSLSRVYLALIHRKFKVEACNNSLEVSERLKRFRPAVVILNSDEYDLYREKLKIPAIKLVGQQKTITHLNDGDIHLKKPVQVGALVKAVERLV
jgi:DNA-binding response OmpR family regulator